MHEKLQRIEPQLVRELVRFSYQQVVEVRREFGEFRSTNWRVMTSGFSKAIISRAPSIA